MRDNLFHLKIHGKIRRDIVKSHKYALFLLLLTREFPE